MKIPRAIRLFALAFAPLLLGCGPDDIVSIDVADGCNPLSPSGACLFPYPSSAYTTEDATSATGVRVSLRADKLPLRDGVTPIDVAPYNTADGFSPAVPILVHFGVDVDLAPLPGQLSIERSLAPAEDSPVALFNRETGRRVSFFVEMDQNRRDDYPGRYAFIIRPVEPMDMGARHVVLLRDDLRDAGGAPLPTSAAFLALRDGAPTNSEAVESLRDHYEDIFQFAEQQGYERGRLLLAWDFPVASEGYLLGSVLSMREKALKEAGETGMAYTITEVQESPNEHLAKIVFGDFEVPTFLRDDDSFEYDADHHPIRQPANRKYPFTMLIPKKADLGEPLPLVVLGHGIFGEGRGFLTAGGDGAAIQALSQELGVVAIATDWIGLSNKDLLRIAGEVAPNLDRLSLITDQLQQSLINTLVMTKLARGALQDDPKVKVGDNKLIDLSRMYYWGASLGGIQGSAFISISPDIPRAVFGVPGCAWSTMLTRSIVFPPIQSLLEPHYPDPLDFSLAISFLQGKFDHADPVNLTKLMFKSPLPDAPEGRIVVLQEAIGDSQVPNISSEMLARAIGVKLLTPSVDPVFGLEAVTAPTEDSVLVHYKLDDFDDPLPPSSNLPPSGENGVHHAMNFVETAQAQIGYLFVSGVVQNFCVGPCDPD
jgi:hypothetical protein